MSSPFQYFLVKSFFRKNELLFSFCVRIMRAISSPLLLCFWKRPCLKRKQKSMSKIEILKKKSIFQSKLFSKKNKFVFLFFVRIMRAIISSLLLCLWKRPCLERKKKSVLYWDSEKSLYFFIFFRILFRKNELWFSVFIRIMK